MIIGKIVKTFWFWMAGFEFMVLSSTAQAVYIPPHAHVFSFSIDTIGIFSNVINEGDFGSLSGSVVDFYGKNWENGRASSLSGEMGKNSSGGLFCFIGKERQIITGGYQMKRQSGPSFPNLSINNPGSVNLRHSNDLRVRGDLNFDAGCLFLNGRNARVDHSITGYSDKSFVVTGSGIGEGSLYLKVSYNENSLKVFPIGTDEGSYTPLGLIGLEPQNGSDNINGVEVFDHVFRHAIKDSPLDSDFVKKTWQITGQVPDSIHVFLQYDETDEGFYFSKLRDSSYVSVYRNEGDAWDVDTALHQGNRPGVLTTGALQDRARMNERSFTNGFPAGNPDGVNWFSISTAYFKATGCPVANFKLWISKRYNYRWVQIFWRTKDEKNVEKYEVQRRRDTALGFHTVEITEAKGSNGFNNRLVYYYYADENPYSGSTDYRLKMTSVGGCVVYTTVQNVKHAIRLKVWPNPAQAHTHVQVLGMENPVVMQVADALGRIVGKYTLEKEASLDTREWADGIYFLIFRNKKDLAKKIGTIKLVVQHGK